MGDTALKRFQWALEGAFTAGAGSVYNGGSAVRATRRLAVGEAVGADWKPTYTRPLEARGSYAGTFQSLLEEIWVTGKIPASVYADDLCYYGRMLWSGAPVVTTLPATPIALLAATTIASTMSLTQQPNAGADGAAARILAVVLTNTAAQTTAVNVTISGQDVRGAALSETLNFSAGTTTPSAVGGGAGALSCTLYTKNYFKTVNAAGIGTSAQPAGDTLAVGGVNAFLWVFTPDSSASTLYSATSEYDDGTAGWQMPGTVLTKGDLQIEFGKDFKFDASFEAQKKAALSAVAGSINPTAPVGDRGALTLLSDNNAPAISSALGNFYADAINTTPGTTLVNARIIDAKFSVDNATKLGKAGDGTPYPNFVGRSYYGDKMGMEFTLLFNSYGGGTTDPSELAQFLAYASRTVRVAVPCQVALPCGQLTSASGWPSALQVTNLGGYYGVIIDSAGKYVVANEKIVDGRQAFTYQQKAEVDLVSMGAAYVVSVVSRINPNML